MSFGGKPRLSALPSLAVLFAAAVILNWPWEMLQMPAYVEMANRSWEETALTCLVTALGDAAITLAIYGLLALLSLVRPGRGKGRRYYALASLLGAGSGVTIEWVALSSGRWSYTPLMPVVPGLGVGLLPLFQLTLLSPAAFRVMGAVGRKWGL